ncbi:CCA tRNA nucleotidyltransferase [Rhizobium sp. NRK18]|uniref:CCA tRNA nucleotidyltransferase n=1 Tax=Rhizobium sp. NRK18 TaxID=2964667 RepID=UPI0021C276F1|nr:CCA tRNA nucleotidyltransferase [Rhizobium sp. NRK18]MCQ2003585.1 CCA tRNA nucleotidyltransferase [Rhizobium sp. NRK18]
MKTVADEAWFKEPALQAVLALLNADGGEARIAGGAVRNALMGIPVGDIDIATTLLPQEVIRRATEAGIKAVPTGIDHGTVTLVKDHTPFEVTTLRKDVQTFGRHAEVAFGTDWQVDAERRDLTINALYADADGKIIDLVNGMPDIETRTVRFIGDAGERIAEDYLRILRFFRFFALYGSGRPDAAGLRASAAARSKLSTLSAERIWSETKKLLGAPNPGRALLWMRQTGVLTEILPETEKWGIDTIPALVEAGTALGWTPDPMLRLMAMVPPDAERLTSLAKRLRLSNAEAAELAAFAGAPAIAEDISDRAFDRLLYRSGSAGIIARLRIDLSNARAKAGADMLAMAKVGRLSLLLERADRWQKPVFPLSGADMLAAGMQPGPKVGDGLKALEEEWVKSNFTMDRESLLARLNETDTTRD